MDLNNQKMINHPPSPIFHEQALLQIREKKNQRLYNNEHTPMLPDDTWKNTSAPVDYSAGHVQSTQK